MLPLTNKEEPVNEDVLKVIRGSGRIVVVDYEEIIRVTARIILKNLGYTVHLVENGKKAVELFRNEDKKIDLVLLDMIMPVMNGRDCFEPLKKLDLDVRVVLSSGFSREEDLQKMMQDGLSGFIRKPYYTSTLSRVIYDALNRG
ncbi:MAG: CheY-like chemotaxis protein [Desulforhopalus sp.]